MVNNNYLESYKIQVVRRIFAGESMKQLSLELYIAKSTLWGWKCKYGSLVAREMELENKPIQYDEFVDITNSSRETKEKPAMRYINPSTITMELGEYRITFDVTNLDKVLEALGYDRLKWYR